MRALMATMGLLLVVWISSCGGGGATSHTTGATTAAGSGGAASSSAGSGGAGGSMPDGGPKEGGAKEAGPMCKVSDAPYDAGVVAAASCASPPPPGAPAPPAPKAYSGGTCPVLAAGTNSITSMGNARSFLLAVPSNLQPSENLPVIFLWYWLRGTSNDFYTIGDVQNAVDQQRFLAVIPNAKGDLFEDWPFLSSDMAPRVDEELAFFDDMLSCVSAQYSVNASCVSAAGVSAGALFTDQLVGARSEYLSSFISLSGGVSGGLLLKPWTPPAHPLPAIVLWGGSMDECLGIHFQDASQALEQGLDDQCVFLVECVHNCGHSEPPFTPAQGMSTYGALWQFVFDHPYWLPAGASPYTTNGLPAGMPPWCAIGAGNAVPRTGACGPSGC